MCIRDSYSGPGYPGGSGGTSLFGAYCYATGGGGGVWEYPYGGSGGDGVNGSLNIPGSHLGSSYLSPPAKPPSLTSAGIIGSRYGGGGGSGDGAYANFAGAAGATGVVIIEY